VLTPPGFQFLSGKSELHSEKVVRIIFSNELKHKSENRMKKTFFLRDKRILGKIFSFIEFCFESFTSIIFCTNHLFDKTILHFIGLSMFSILFLRNMSVLLLHYMYPGLYIIVLVGIPVTPHQTVHVLCNIKSSNY